MQSGWSPDNGLVRPSSRLPSPAGCFGGAVIIPEAAPAGPAGPALWKAALLSCWGDPVD